MDPLQREISSDENSPCFIPCIQRIPNGILKQNESAYHPSMVSIGPLHRKDPHLHAMEAVKQCYMDSLLKRKLGLPETELKRELEGAVKELEAPARQCYAERCDDDQNFAEIMLNDGCFIIELLFRNYHGGHQDDPNLHNCMRLVPIRKDLLLLENQIPFFVLKKLFNIITQKYIFPSLTDYIEYFFSSIMMFKIEKGQTETVPKEEEDATVCHILHLLHKFCTKKEKKTVPKEEEEDATFCRMLHLLHKFCKQTDEEEEETVPKKEEEEIAIPLLRKKEEPSQVPTAKKEEPSQAQTAKKEENTLLKYSATDLDISGVKLEAAANVKDLFAVKFTTDHRSCFWLCRRGRFQIPSFNMYDDTHTFLRNIIAFELTSMGKNHYYFTSLAFLMDKLIHTADDVKLLEQAGIIHNHLGSRDELSTLFTNICKNTYAENYCFNKSCMQVNNYCKQLCPKLRRTYFSNPWSSISAIAASILFVLTLVQTIYALLSYY